MDKTIMAVDDSVSMRFMLSSTLKEAGYEVLEAVDGREALAKLEGSHIDMLITDLNMENMDGIELTREVRKIPSLKAIPVIILTTEADPEVKMSGKAAGASGWMVKPFKPEQLLNIIEKVLR
ncbi:MAG: response regulator [Deltaproteobacteria bacterium]|nr:response regulator [Deltaproteobacteria bacterium]